MMMQRLVLVAGVLLGMLLPGEVVEYVEATGEQWVDTGVRASSRIRIVADMQFTRGSYSTQLMMGWAASDPYETGEAILFGINAAMEPRTFGGYFNQGYISPVSFTKDVDLARHTFDFANGSQKIDGVEYGTTTINDAKLSNKGTLYLFARNREWSSDPDWKCFVKMYGCRIYDGDTCVADYVPYRTGEGVFGLSNTVDGVFSPSGSAVPLTGPVDEEIKYVESTGEQYLDTGYCPVANTRLVAKVQFTSVSGAWQGNGWHSNGGKEAFVFAVIDGRFKTVVSPNNQWQDSGVTADTKEHVFDLRSGSQILDEKEFGTSTYSNSANPNPTFFLFARHAEWVTEPSGANNYSRMRVFWCKFYEGETLVMDLMPCLRNGLAGLKDRVSGRFIAAKGFPLKGSLELTKRESVMSLGKSYLDTYEVPNANTRIETEIQHLEGNAQEMQVMGWAASNPGEGILFGRKEGTFSCAFVPNNYTTSVSVVLDGSPVMADCGRHVWDLQSGSQKFDGREFGTATIGNTATTGQTMYLFARHAEWQALYQGNADSYAPCRIFSCKIYSNGVLKREFVPCLANGKYAGLLDVQSGVFIPSANAHPLVVRGLGVKPIKYVEAKGVQYVDTGVVPKSTTRVVADMRFTHLTPGVNQIMGWAASSPGEGLLLGSHANGTWGGFQQMGYSAPLEYGKSADTKRHVWDFGPGVQKIDDVVVSETSIESKAEPGQTFYLFGRHREWSDSIDWLCQLRLFSCQIYDGDTLVRDLIPAIVDGRACLYDQVYEKPYYSLSGVDLVAGMMGEAGFMLILR